MPMRSALQVQLCQGTYDGQHLLCSGSSLQFSLEQRARSARRTTLPENVQRHSCHLCFQVWEEMGCEKFGKI